MIVTFGEIMQRLVPENYNRLLQAEKFVVTYAGGEANVAVSLMNLGEKSSFVTKVPSHEVGQAAVNSVRKYGVYTDDIIRGGESLGSYYVEKGASQRASKVIYNRKHSAISKAKRDEFDWDKILKDAKWFHFTGITPALGGELADICLDALKVCKKNNITVSCDINYRKNLWSKENASEVMSKLMPYVNVCIANEEDIADVFGIHAKDTDITGGKISHEGYSEVASQLMQRFDLQKVAITLRGSVSANDNNWAAMLYDGEKSYISKNYLIHIVDRVGGGDSFAGALIYALVQNYDLGYAIEFAVAASCLKHTIEGDFNLVSIDEVEKLAGGDGSGRISR